MVIFFNYRLGSNLFLEANRLILGTIDWTADTINSITAPLPIIGWITKTLTNLQRNTAKWIVSNIFHKIAKVDPVRFYYPPEFGTHHRGDICLILSGPVSNRTYDVRYPGILTQKDVKHQRRKEIADLYKTCYIYGYDVADQCKFLKSLQRS